MFIKTLRIVDTTNDVVMRQVDFHMGANLVRDTETSESHNKVGKTTFLKLIDILMGAGNKKLLYTDNATNAITVDLQNIISDRRIAAELELADSLESSHGRIAHLRVDLFPRGHYFIDGERLSASAYRERLNQLIFGINDNVPTFRQLIASFVRVAVGGDSDKFLRMLPNGNYATYRAIYNHLFKISDPRLDKELSELKLSQSRTRESLRQYKRVNGVDTAEQQEQILAALEAEYEKLKTRADDIIDADEYQRNRRLFSDVRNRYAELNDQLNAVEYRIRRNAAALAEIQEENGNNADPGLVQRFYDEIKSLVPSVGKTFEDMITFNRKLSDNRAAYFQDIGKGLASQREQIQRQIDNLVASNGRYLSLVANNKIDEYDHISAQMDELRQKIGQRRQVVESLQKFDEDLAKTQADIDRYSTGGEARGDNSETYQERMKSFNSYFTALAEKINGEKPILVYSTATDEFPVSITDIDGSSTGTRKSLLAAYDLAYQQFAQENGVQVPHFVVHDVVENIEGDNFSAILEAANNINCQYIVAVLKEKLDSSGIPEDVQRTSEILALSSDDMFFDGKTVGHKAAEVINAETKAELKTQSPAA